VAEVVARRARIGLDVVSDDRMVEVGRAQRIADAEAPEPGSADATAADTPAADTTDKVCAVCGRRITWRAKWARDWEQVRYCSAACRRDGLGPTGAALEVAIRDLLAARAGSATICPSEAARRVAARDGRAGAGAAEEGWRALMEPARRAARRLVARGEVEIVQAGRLVDPSTAKGPIRIRRAR